MFVSPVTILLYVMYVFGIFPPVNDYFGGSPVKILLYSS